MKKFKSMVRRRIGGFSLIEIVITISIIAILSVISGPIYRSYADKAVLAEGYALLGTIRSAQENYHNDTGYFLHGYYGSARGHNVATCYEEVLGIDARHNKYYKTFITGQNTSIESYNSYRNGFRCTVRGPQNLTMEYLLTSGVTML